jgi:beta-N-acetylhexosaminidase
MIPFVLIVSILASQYDFKDEVDEGMIQPNDPTTGIKKDISMDLRPADKELKENEIIHTLVTADDDRFYKISLVKEEPSPAQILSQMSLDEKIGQLIISGVNGTSIDSNDKRLITVLHVGGVIFYSKNIKSVPQTKQMVKDLKEINRTNNLPLFMSVDQEGGRVSRLPGVVQTPTNKEIGEKNDKHYAYSIGEKLGENLKSFGFNLDYAPVLDINSNPDNPIIGDRSYSSTASVVSNLGVQTMKGIQSKNIISVVKHFPGHGDTSVDSHIQLPVVTKNLKQLQALELIPFKKAIQNGADVVMVAHILLPQIDDQFPASMSKKVITNVLRNQLNYEGVIITDDMTMGAVIKNYGIGEAAVASLKAGSDLILVAHEYENAAAVFNSIKTAVKNGEIAEQRIDESVERIIRLKGKYLM